MCLTTLITNKSVCSDDGPDCRSYESTEQRPETYIVPFIFSLIFVVGVVGNGTLVFIFLRHRSMRNIPNTYIFSLALADLLVIIICVPLASLVYTLESWPWGSALCRVTEFAKDISIGVSVFTLTALSAERYYAIVNPLQNLQTKSLTVLTAVIIWIVAIICATPAAIMSQTILIPLTVNKSITVCWPFGQPGPPCNTYAK